MKNAKTTTEIKSDWKARICSGQYYRNGIEARKFSGAMPSPMELATLAATLASGPADNPEKLCASALKLWFASHEAITLQQQCNEDQQQLDQQLEAARNARPKPPKDQVWPIDWETCRKILWPGKDEADSAPAIRAWLKASPKTMLLGKSEPQEYTYEMLKSNPIDERQFYALQPFLLSFYQQWKLPVNSAVKSENAKRGWRYCDAKMQETPEYQEFNTECEERQRKPYERYFVMWLKDHKQKPFERLAALVKKKITSPS
jgi:hypothetical protein